LMTQTRQLPRRHAMVTVLPFARRGGTSALKAREKTNRRRQDALGTRVSWQWASRNTRGRKLELAAMFVHDPFHEGPVVQVTPVADQENTWTLSLVDPSARWSVGEGFGGSITDQDLTLTVPAGQAFYVDDGTTGQLLQSP